MKKTVTKFSSFEEQQKADDEYYKNLSIEERLVILINLIGYEDPENATIERSVKIYPIPE